ncbi:MAG: hypothetical protein Q9195_009312 [Heterodermia aff. obscurata]
MAEQTSPIVEFSAAVYEFARFMAPGSEDVYLKKYLDSQHLAEFPYGTFTDWSPDPSFLLSLPASVTSSMSSVLPSSSISPVAQSASSASSLEQDMHGPADHPALPNPSPPSILPNQTASNPDIITISQGAVTSKYAYGRGSQSSFVTPNAELIPHPTSSSSQLQPTRLPPRPIQANHSIIQQVSHKLEKESSVDRPQAGRVSKNQGQQKAPRVRKDTPGSRASRAHFYMLTVHGKLLAGDELRVPISLPSGVLDTGIFTDVNGMKTDVLLVGQRNRRRCIHARKSEERNRVRGGV